MVASGVPGVHGYQVQIGKALQQRYAGMPLIYTYFSAVLDGINVTS
jgi:hypothetical protein